MTDPPEADEAILRALLAANGISPSEEEFVHLLAHYSARRPGTEALHALPEARYAAPGLVFTATPVFADWA